MPLLAAKPPPAIPTEEIEDYKFRLPERTRREVFAELATAELAERARAIQAEHVEGPPLVARGRPRALRAGRGPRCSGEAQESRCLRSTSCWTRGCRERWPGPDGKPLPATTPPLDLRSGQW